jgi:uncharacterized DUF497 family protein
MNTETLMEDQNKLLHEVTQRDYRFGFVTDIETDTIVKGLNEEVIRIISARIPPQSIQTMADNENARMGTT